MKRQILAVAVADLRQRLRSRRLLLVLVLVAYFGFQFTVGTFELLYQHTVDGQTVDYRGEPTSAYVGLTTGVTGALFLFLGGYYVLSGSLTHARETGVSELVASSHITDRAYLLGTWLSHIGLVAVMLATLSAAAMVNHAVHGTGTTNPLWILGAVFLVGLPVGCLVAGITILFQSSVRLRGTAGNVLYFFGALTALAGSLTPALDLSPTAEVPPWIQAIDVVGLYAVGETTIDAMLTVAPDYDGPPLANYGLGAGEQTVTYQWDGGTWPVWFLANRFGLILLGIVPILFAAILYDRFEDSADGGEAGRFAGVLARLRNSMTSLRAASTEIDVDPSSTSPVSDRSSGGFGRLLNHELRLLIRGHQWWWYVGTILIIAIGVTGRVPSEILVPIAAIWPLFLWSAMGSRIVRHRMMPLIISSNQPYRQLAAEWIAGGLLTLIVLGSALWPAIAVDPAAVIVLAGVVLFVPSLAQAMGLWSGTRRLFELTYLVLWYVGPLNGVAMLDFAGATTETVHTAVPLVFIVVGSIALTASLGHRYRQA